MTWFLIFERTAPGQSPGAVQSSGLFGGSRQDPPQYRTFKPVMIVEVPAGDEAWKDALEAAVKATKRLGEFAAVECNVFVPELIEMRRRGPLD